MHGEWKKNGNVWIYQYNGIVQTLEKPEKVNKLVLSDNLMDFLNQLLEK